MKGGTKYTGFVGNVSCLSCDGVVSTNIPVCSQLIIKQVKRNSRETTVLWVNKSKEKKLGGCNPNPKK